MDDFTVEIKGLDELQRTLEELPYKVAKKGLRASLKAGAEPIRNGMVTGAPKLTGFLSKHFGTKFKMNKNELAGSAFIGPQGKIEYPAFISGAYRIVRTTAGRAKKVGRIAVMTVARYLEFGTSKMSKKPFMTQAFETNKEAALAAVIEKLKGALNP